MEGGTVVKLPPAPSATMENDAAAAYNNRPTAADNDVTTANINRRNASREERKRELLIEARKARIDWILGGVTDDTKDLKEVLNGLKNPLRDLQACDSNGVSCAPDVVEALFTSKLQGENDRNITTSRIALEVKRILEHEHLSWDNVSSSSICAFQTAAAEEDNQTTVNEQSDMQSSTLTSPSVPSTQSYNIFLQILCQPDAADVVFSIQKFCKTIEEAAEVILSVQEEEKQKEMNDKLEKEKMMMQAAMGSGKGTSQAAAVQNHNHAESLSKAVRGFIKKSLRDMKSHDAFKIFPPSEHQNMESDVVNEDLMACLETFVFTKCHNPIYRVLGAELESIDNDHALQSSLSSESSLHTPDSRKTADELELELQEKIKLLQFVTPEHLEIHCLKSAHDNSIDLSKSVDCLQSIKHQSSPRQMLRSILLAYRAINSSLNTVLLNKDKGATPSPSPPSADDILPTLILAVLRAKPERIVSDLRFIESFAPISLLRGEAGYAYTNLCGAIQFLCKLDMDSHAAEVSLGEEGAHLSISPGEFRAGIEQSKQAMKVVENKIQVSEKNDQHHVDADQNNSIELQWSEDNVNQFVSRVKISGRDIRQARESGESVDMEWAIKKQKDIWQEDKFQTVSTDFTHDSICNDNLLPENPPLPPHFNRSYSFLSTRPENIRICELPNLLSEYRMLVHATESLLNERSTWREAQKKRQMQLARVNLERDFNEVIGESLSTETTNGHSNKS
eukprot:scaffold82592_cov67-Cyclotella_meneghiniana.AAC.10